MGGRESGTRGDEVQRVTDIPCMFHCELPRPADAKQATVVLSACVWCLHKRERKTVGKGWCERKKLGGPWCKTSGKTNRKRV